MGLGVSYAFWRVKLETQTLLCVYAMNYVSEYDVEVFLTKHVRLLQICFDYKCKCMF